jgi:hypothetical protein
VTSEELATLKAYLAPWTAELPAAEPAGVAGEKGGSGSLGGVSAELNGVPFDSTFESWKLMSTTDRGDNSTFRFILGNDGAVKAAQSGNITPWPDGARFAKIAWQQVKGADGLVYPGKFIQVELMVKEAKGYKKTEGWGWGRWRGLDLKPYGKDAGFVDECTTCHLPVRGNDYVYTLPITSARVMGQETVNNNAAALPASLPYQPLTWNPITMYVDPKSRTTATLFGNEAAVEAARGDGARAKGKSALYPEGAVLALVTWGQRDDPHWFGARVPDHPQSVEFVRMGAEGKLNSYRRFDGADLAEDQAAAGIGKGRVNFVLGLAPAQLP